MNLNRILLLLALIAIIGGSVWWKISSLQSDLDIAKADIATLNERVGSKNSAIANRDNVINELEASKKELINTIEERNTMIDVSEAKYKASQKSLAEWMAKPAKEKFVYITKKVIDPNADYDKGVCEDGLKLNQAIANINYEDL